MASLLHSIRKAKKTTRSVLGVSLLVLLVQTFTSNVMLVSITFAGLYPSNVFAHHGLPHDEINDAGEAGMTFGQTLLRSPSYDGTNIYWDGNEGAESVEINGFFPQNGETDDSAAMESNDGFAAAADILTAEVQSRLSTEESQQGEAYRTIWDSMTSRSHPDLIEDPYLTRSKEIMDGDDPIFDAFFTGCAEIPITIPNESDPVHVPDIRNCTRVKDVSQNCLIQHDYQTDLIRYVSGPVNIASCGVGCMNIWIGTVGDNYWGGWCDIFEESMRIEVTNPDAIISATLEYAKWDDYMQVWLNSSMIWTGPDGNFPPETAGSCELARSWEWNLNVDVTPSFKAGGVIDFRNRTSVAGNGEGYSRIRINYDPSLAIINDVWSVDPLCEEAILGLYDGACTGTIQCENGPPIPESGCIDFFGVLVCESLLSDPPVPLYQYPFVADVNGNNTPISKFCQQVSVNADCSPLYTGELTCYTNLDGELVCPTNEGLGELDTCVQYESDPNCAFVSSECFDNAYGDTGICYIVSEVWDCGYDVSLPGSEQTQTICDGPIRCIGEECVVGQRESNPDFGRAAGITETINFMGSDMDCVVDINGNNICTIFAGEPSTCKVALAGAQNCCETPGGVSMRDYLLMAMATWDLAQSIDLAEKMASIGLDVAGAWESISQTVSATWESVTEPFTSAWGEMAQSWGSAETAEEVSTVTLDQLKQQITNSLGEWMTETFGPEVAGMFFTEDAVTGEFVANGPFIQGAQFIMTAYMYYQIAIVLINIIWECTLEELQLGAKRELKSCTYVGNYCSQDTLFGCIEETNTYCCYNSPLARIVNEGAKPQLGLDYGTPQSPECGGLTIEELTNIDWNQIDLGEWYAILANSGIIPETAPDAESMYNIDAATTNAFADVPVPSGPERINQRFQAIDDQGVTTFEDTRDSVRSSIVP